jgi:hypothetical protein
MQAGLGPGGADATVIQYLLGDLEEDEISLAEQRYFSDKAYFDRVRFVEAALIRAYLAGRLGPHETSLFEQKYLEVPELRKKVLIANQGRELPRRRGGRPRPWPVFVSLRPAFGYGLAMAVIVCATSTVWFMTENVRLGRDIAQLRAGSAPHADQAPATPKFLGGGIVSLVLLPGISKGSDNNNSRTLPFAAASQEIRLQLELPGVREDRAVAAELYRTEPETRRLMNSSDGLHLTPTARGRTVLVVFPPGTIQTGDYVIYIKPSVGAPAASALGSYVFSVAAE